MAISDGGDCSKEKGLEPGERFQKGISTTLDGPWNE